MLLCYPEVLISQENSQCQFPILCFLVFSCGVNVNERLGIKSTQISNHFFIRWTLIAKGMVVYHRFCIEKRFDLHLLHVSIVPKFYLSLAAVVIQITRIN